MIRYKFCFFCLLSLTITGCSAYQKHFGGVGHDYTNTKTTKQLQATKNEYPLNKNNRYTIPEIPGKWTKPVTDLYPPDYSNKEVDKKVK